MNGRWHFLRSVYLLAFAILVAVVVPTSTRAAVDCDNPPQDYTADDFKSPMRFFTPEGNVCLGNAVNNPYMAVGMITADTPLAFAEFAKKNPPNAPIEFISPGGNLLGALKLGELIRNGGYDTSLGKVCASACAYAIMGGVKRYVVQSEFDQDSDYDNRNVGATGTKLGIHQFYQSDALNEPQKRAFSAIDKSADQVLMGILLEYALRMGVDTRLVSVASSIPPWQEIRWLGRVLINAGIGRMSALGANWTRRDSGNDVNDPNVWSGRASQEGSSIWWMWSCINVSGL
jgi:hypothetical protein